MTDTTNIGIDPRTVRELEEIRTLITEMYKHWETHSDDHHCKSSEGAISLTFPEFFWRDERMRRPGVSIYSYVMGPSRLHHFENASKALVEARKWHQSEMNHDYSLDWED